MRRNLVILGLATFLMTACVSRDGEYTDPPCGVKESEAGLCKQPVY